MVRVCVRVCVRMLEVRQICPSSKLFMWMVRVGMRMRKRERADSYFCCFLQNERLDSWVSQ